MRYYWEIIADNLSASGWSWGCISAIDSNGRTIWIADAHRDAKFRGGSHRAVIRVYDQAGNVIETHEHVGDFKEP